MVFDLLKQFFFWCLIIVGKLVVGILAPLVAVWPHNWVSPMGEVVSYFQVANRWAPITEIGASLVLWLALVGVYFVVKVVLYLF